MFSTVFQIQLNFLYHFFQVNHGRFGVQVAHDLIPAGIINQPSYPARFIHEITEGEHSGGARLNACRNRRISLKVWTNSERAAFRRVLIGGGLSTLCSFTHRNRGMLNRAYQTATRSVVARTFEPDSALSPNGGVAGLTKRYQPAIMQSKPPM